MKFVPKKVSRNIGRKILVAKKNSPHIFFATGIVGVVGSTVLACRATLKLEKTLDDIKDDINVVNGLDLDRLSDREHAQAVGKVYINSGVELVKLYGPSIVIGGISIAALTGSHVQLARRNTALTVTLGAVMKAYEQYRIRVQDEVGEKRELEIYRGLGDDTVEIEGHKKKVQTTDPNAWSIYTRIFDESNVNWQRDSELNRIFIQCQQNYANHMLQSRGHVLLNDVYDQLGFNRSKAGAIVGWVLDGPGDGYIDFGLFEAASARFMNNMEQSIILDFNVDGVVYDKIEE